MSEDQTGRPKRAAGPDDTPDAPQARPRRGAAPDEAPAPNPFARPGTPAASGASPSQAGNRGIFEDHQDHDNSQPQPRRSALSSTTPTEFEMIPPPPVVATQTADLTTPVTTRSWLEHHRRTLLIWLVGALVAALLVSAGVYLVRRNAEPPATDTPTSSASPTEAESTPPPVGEADLMTLEDAELVVPGASWAIAATSTDESGDMGRVACLRSPANEVNTLWTLQRMFGTSDSDQLAALHQIDVYASEDAAIRVQAERAASLAACDEEPAQIMASTEITGLADEVLQLTVAQEDDPASYHTLLLVRSGRSLTMVDVVRDSEAVNVGPVVDGITRSLSSICTGVDGTCPGVPAFAAAMPPPSDPVGWLQTSDFPRITPGAGRWTATAPTHLTSQGMGCENLTLSSESGPTERAQRTYLLTQDELTPSTFGIDEMTFEFGTTDDAGAFAQKLGNNLAKCGDRLLNAKVTELPAATGTGADGTPLSSRIMTVQLEISDNETVLYQLAVSTSGLRVSYLLMSVTPDYQFSDAQMTALALRAAQRQSQ